MMPKTLVILPSIRHGRLPSFYTSFLRATYGGDFDLFVVGPKNENGINAGDINDAILSHYDYGSPTRCVQKIMDKMLDLKKYDYFTWTTDDAKYTNGTLTRFIEKLHKRKQAGDKVFGSIKYTEDGPPNWVTGADDIYYVAGIHDSLKNIPGVNVNHKLAMVGVYTSECIEELGGLDCRYDHINLSTHDLAFRAQRSGYECVLSDEVVMHCNSNSSDADHMALDRANVTDYQKFVEQYQTPPLLSVQRSNWSESPEVWSRFK